MTPTFKTLIGLALIGSAGAAVAQTPAQTLAPATPQTRSAPTTRAEAIARADQMFAALDLNHDGTLTQEEARQARQQRMQTMREQRRTAAFERLDANDDNQISREEFAASGDRGGNGRHRGFRRGGRHGGGGAMAMRMFGTEGSVTAAQFRTFATERFDRLDANHDGTLTPEERRAGRRGGRFMGPDGAPPPPAAPAQN